MREFVDVGCRVTIENNGKLQKYLIVGREEADPKLGKISNESPLGKLLLGKKEGETISLTLPAGITSYEIIKID